MMMRAWNTYSKQNMKILAGKLPFDDLDICMPILKKKSAYTNTYPRCELHRLRAWSNSSF